MNNKLYYLASPYSHPDALVRKTRAMDVTKSAIDFLRQGVFVFAPISYNEPWKKYNLPGDWQFWCDFDKTFLSRCNGGVIVLQLDGWKESVGVTAEIEFALSIGLPVYYATAEQIKSGDLSFMADSCCTGSLFCSGQKL